MPGKFNLAAKAEWIKLDWGELAHLSGPKATRAKGLVIFEVKLAPGAYHNFHRHPRQEELIYVVRGKLEQWLEKKTQVLKAGDSVFIPKNTVHGSFNVYGEEAVALAILSPSVGKEGYELIDVSARFPWKSLRRAPWKSLRRPAR